HRDAPVEDLAPPEALPRPPGAAERGRPRLAGREAEPASQCPTTEEAGRRPDEQAHTVGLRAVGAERAGEGDAEPRAVRGHPHRELGPAVARAVPGGRA